MIDVIVREVSKLNRHVDSHEGDLTLAFVKLSRRNAKRKWQPYKLFISDPFAPKHHEVRQKLHEGLQYLIDHLNEETDKVKVIIRKDNGDYYKVSCTIRAPYLR
jgi:hypothetical protein